MIGFVELMERQWKLNLSFYKGKQYVFYNRKSRRIEALPVCVGVCVCVGV